MTLLGKATLAEVRTAPLINLEGVEVRRVELPRVFATEPRPELINRAFFALLSHKFQPKGAWKGSAHKYSVESLGAGYGMARIARITARGTGKSNAGGFVPTSVGGRPTHPPVPEKRIRKEINKKERRSALASAIAFTASREHVVARGHRVPEGVELPIIVEDELQSIKRSKDLLGFFRAVGLHEELARCREKKVRPGKGKMRGRRYKRRVGPLIVVTETRDVARAARNIPGVDVVNVKDLSVLHLAPGGKPGRLTIYTNSALERLRG